MHSSICREATTFGGALASREPAVKLWITGTAKGVHHLWPLGLPGRSGQAVGRAAPAEAQSYVPRRTVRRLSVIRPRVGAAQRCSLSLLREGQPRWAQT